MSAPSWSPTDDDTTDLLSLVADVEHPSVDLEWEAYLTAVRYCADYTGRIDPNDLRFQVRGKIAPRRIGAFTNRALRSGLVEYTGEWVVSTDTEGRNSGKPARVMRLKSSAPASRLGVVAGLSVGKRSP